MHHKWAGIALIAIALLSATGTTLGVIPQLGAPIDTALGAAGAYLAVGKGR